MGAVRLLTFSFITLLLVSPVAHGQTTMAQAEIDSLIEEVKRTYYGRPDSALQMAREALDMATEIGYDEGRLRGLRWIGNAHFLLGRLDSAATYMLRLLDIAYDEGNLSVQADVMIDIGQTYDEIDMHSLAFDYFSQAHEIRLKMGDPERIAVTTINLAYHYLLRGELDSALVYYGRTQKIYENTPELEPNSFLYNELSSVYLQQGRYDEARESINIAIELDKETNNNWNLCYDYVVLAQLELELGDVSKAEGLVLDALRISEESGVVIEKDLIYKMLSDLKTRQGKYREALDYLTMGYQYADSLNLTRRGQKILALDHYKREKENQIATLELTSENHRKDDQIMRQRFLIISIAIVLVVTFGAAGLLFRQNRRLASAQSKIEDQNVDLKLLNSSKSKLFSIVTHDIRNPLAHLNSMLKMVANGEITKEEFTEFTGLLVDHTDRLTTLSETLIDWSRSQEVGLSAEKEAVNISDLIARSVDQLSHMADEKSIELKYENGQQVDVQVDPTMMTLALNNLLTNAIKFTPTAGEIVIRAKAKSKKVKIHIEDSGVGIDPDLIDNLKKGDVRTQRGTDNERGTGIGLMLTLDLIVLNGGRLDAVKNEEKGSTFTITLPQA